MTGRVLWVVGGGSGMGRAAAVTAARAGWTVAVSGRRPDSLDETLDAVRAVGGRGLAVPLDVQDRAAVAAGRDTVLAEFGRLDGLVVAAGRNTPQRTWADQDLAEFEAIVATNLTGVAATVAASLPELRKNSGVVVVISSYSGWTYAAGAGVAYSASKTALSSLTRTLNAAEAVHGVRACHLCPGDVATDFLDKRPVVPDAEARAVMLTADDVATAVQFVLDAPSHVRIDELVISPVAQR